jgi:hypothetical protein
MRVYNVLTKTKICIYKKASIKKLGEKIQALCMVFTLGEI